jgi:hypothetical protein
MRLVLYLLFIPSSDNDSAHLFPREDVLYGDHRYGDSLLFRGVSVGYLPQCVKQLLKFLPTSKFIDYQQILDKTTVR